LANIEGFQGGSSDDVIAGSDVDNLIAASGGHDRLDAGGGFDYLKTLPNDTVDLTLGRLKNVSGATAELNGFEAVMGAGGNETLLGDASNNRFEGWEGSDVLAGRSGNDHLLGGDGNDLLQGGVGRSTSLKAGRAQICWMVAQGLMPFPTWVAAMASTLTC
jgi:Ca2+-binding RTX toxin-like protein